MSLKLDGVHVLLTFTCTFECDHCFVWGSPRQEGVLTLDRVIGLLDQADELGTVEWFYFEGGEPFLFYPVLVRAVESAHARGYRVGIVSNAYWATAVPDAVEWLRPLAGMVEDLSLSSDLFHCTEEKLQLAANAEQAARELAIPVGTMAIAQPGKDGGEAVVGQLPIGESPVRFRGRAAVELIGEVTHQPWTTFDECPCEDFRDPGRVHVDPLGNVHICQGISIGNVFRSSLREICEAYDPDAHPVIGPLLAGGPVELVRRHGLDHADAYADACHLCYDARLKLRDRFPETLGPDQVYGVGL